MSITKLGKDKYLIIVEAGKDPGDGHRARIKRRFHGSSKEAELLEAKLKIEVSNGTYIKPTKTTVKSYFTSWIEDYGKLKLAPKTYERYKEIIDLRVIPWMGAIELDKLKPADLRKFYNRLLTEGQIKKSNKGDVLKKLRERYPNLTSLMESKKGKTVEQWSEEHGVGRGNFYHLKLEYERKKNKKDKPEEIKKLSPDSIKYHHRVIHRILEHAVKIDEILTRNVADIAKPIIPEDYYEDDLDGKEDVSIFDREQLKVIETGLYNSNSPFYELVGIDIRTGLRRGELIGLKWPDINFKDSNIKVRRAISYTKEKGIFFKRTKGKSNRTIDISEDVVKLLKRVQLNQNKAKLKMENSSEEYHEDGLVFCQYNGLPIHPDTPTKWFPAYLKSIGLPELNFHCLRHTHASLLLEAAATSPDITMKMISERLGHSSIRITMDIYSHLMPGMQKNAVNSLDRLLK